MSRRRWFQFHLSTLVLLTLVAGGLMWLNFRPRERWVVVPPAFLNGFTDDFESLETQFEGQEETDYGWPMTCCTARSNYHNFAPTAPLPELTAQQRKEHGQLPDKDEYDLEYLRAVAPSLMDRVRFETVLRDEEQANRTWSCTWEWKPVALNLLVAGALLIGTGLTCEFVTRRRMKAKERQSGEISA